MEHSDQINEIMDALSKAHAKFKPVLRKAENPYFQSSYAELYEYIEASREGLAEFGLACVQTGNYNPEEQGVVISTLIGHSSGQWILDRLWIPVSKPDAQGVGSAITYGRRYARSALLDMAAQGEDDDANASVGMQKGDYGAKTTDKDPKKGVKVNPAQLRALWAAMKSSKRTEAEFRTYLFDKYGIHHSKDILKENLDNILKWLVGTEDDGTLTKTLQKSVKQVQREPGDDDEPRGEPLDFERKY